MLLKETPLFSEDKIDLIEDSTKIQVLDKILPLWKKENHKCLIFSQTVKMLDILEQFLELKRFTYMRMDGTTNVNNRNQMITEFNENPDIFIFLLTTKVGGVGINLTGADRVVIFDPDWNPATDLQARERSWRIGQEKNVTIYRLLTSGTIEDKIYQKQLYKQFLTSKILSDPKQTKSFFKAKGLKDLFTLKETDDNQTQKLFYEIANVDNKGEHEDETTDDEDHILRGIMGNNTFLNHEKMVQHEGSTNKNSDENLIQLKQHALSNARMAAEKLRESRKDVQKTPISTPTFTGKRGKAGKKRRFGNISNHLDVPIRVISKKRRVSLDDELLQSKNLKRKKYSNPDLLIKSIRNFLEKCGGSASSEQIIQKFENKITSEQNLLLKQMLKEIATCKKGTWTLKNDFV
eukprot:TRINITY_DN4279_c0_g1_i3.p1 TRINITY_DN4279_c0_g1~~TRINITY_DN4279_c0_g1_i3.p1  ORF type:complete len:406 (+),score=87.75 TRINITY_DN4279_c0_g1_i3:1487-2704(+)